MNKENHIKVFILIDEKITNQEFVLKYSPQIQKYMDRGDVKFYFTDQNIILSKFLNKRGYRNCKIYHLDKNSKHNIGNYKKKGNHISYSEIYYILREKANITIE